MGRLDGKLPNRLYYPSSRHQEAFDALLSADRECKMSYRYNPFHLFFFYRQQSSSKDVKGMDSTR
jgi:hypothetical protein